MKTLKKILFLAALVMTIHMSMGEKVYAADGRLIIALSDSDVTVGNTVKATLSAWDSKGDSAVAEMEFTYDTNAFSFVSCSANNYSGGPGGKVSFTGTRIIVTLKAIGDGDTRVVVTGKNGRIKSSGEALKEMVAAGAAIKTGNGGSANQNTDNNSGENVKSNDNSISALSLSVGKLSPAFSYAITEYTATVPYGVTEVTVSAKPTAEKAKIESITGNTDLQVGENTIAVTVAAEDGSKASYTILVTREAEFTQDSDGDTSTEITEGESTETIGDNEQIKEYESKLQLWEKEYNRLKEKYEAEKLTSKKTIIILVFIIVFLIIICINLLLLRRKPKNKKQENIQEKMKKIIKNTTVREEQLSLKKEPKTKETSKAKEEPKIKEVPKAKEEPKIKEAPKAKESPKVKEEPKIKKESKTKKKVSRRIKRNTSKGDMDIMNLDDL